MRLTKNPAHLAASGCCIFMMGIVLGVLMVGPDVPSKVWGWPILVLGAVATFFRLQGDEP